MIYPRGLYRQGDYVKPRTYVRSPEDPVRFARVTHYDHNTYYVLEFLRPENGPIAYEATSFEAYWIFDMNGVELMLRLIDD